MSSDPQPRVVQRWAREDYTTDEIGRVTAPGMMQGWSFEQGAYVDDDGVRYERTGELCRFNLADGSGQMCCFRSKDVEPYVGTSIDGAKRKRGDW